MNKLPYVIVNEIFKYLGIKEFLTYRLVSQESKQIINRLFRIVKIACNNLVENLKMFQYVRYLDLQFCRQVNDDMFKCLENIYCINLRGCSKITDRGLKYLMGVREINLAGCHKITDRGIKNLKRVTFIDLSYCPNITGIGMAQWNDCPVVILDNFPNSPHVSSNIDRENIYMLLELKLIKIELNNTHPFLNYSNNKTIVYPDTKKYDNKFDDEEYDIEYKNNFASTKEIRSINEARCLLFDKVYKSEVSKRDKVFMKNYEKLLPNSKLLNHKKAKKRLYRNNNIAIFIKKIKLYQIDALIGGSMGLSCVYNKADFIPGDLDLYIKKINKKKLLLLENIIYKSFKINNIVVIRNPITVTWYIHHYDNTLSDTINESIITIQVNLFNIESWAEVFVTYHTDLTCIGYEILTDKFIYLTDRWENILNNDIHYFTNILNLDFPANIINACNKYKTRGFNCVAAIGTSIKDSSHNIPYLMQYYYDIILGTSSGSLNYASKRTPHNCLPNILYEKYYDVENIEFASSVDYLFIYDEISPDIKFLSVYKINTLFKNNKISNKEIISVKKFLKMPDTLRQKNGKICDYYREYYTVGVKCPKCCNITSLKSYLSWNKKPDKRSYYNIRTDICKHFQDSRCPSWFNYQWYPELITI